MNLSLYVNPIKNMGVLNDTSDFFLTPLKILLDKPLFTFRGFSNNDASDMWIASVKIHTIVEKIFALFLTLTLVPLLIGGMLKVLALHEDPQLRFFYENLPGSVVLNSASLSLAPKSVSLEIQNDEEIRKLYQIYNYLHIWDEVGYNHPQYDTLKESLEDWVKNKIPFIQAYTHIPSSQVKRAQQQLITELSMILQEFDHPSFTNDAKKAIIIELIEASIVCTPTWLEVTHKIYANLKFPSFEDHLLRLVQQNKENVLHIILEDKNKHIKDSNQKHQWHELNPFRAKYGLELGLVMDNLINDSAYNPKLLHIKRSEFDANYSVNRLIDYVHSQLQLVDKTDAIIEYLMSKASPYSVKGSLISKDTTEAKATILRCYFTPSVLFAGYAMLDKRGLELFEHYKSLINLPNPSKHMIKMLDAGALTDSFEQFDALDIEERTEFLNKMPLAHHEYFRLYNAATMNSKRPLMVFQMASLEAKAALQKNGDKLFSIFLKEYSTADIATRFFIDSFEKSSSDLQGVLKGYLESVEALKGDLDAEDRAYHTEIRDQCEMQSRTQINREGVIELLTHLGTIARF